MTEYMPQKFFSPMPRRVFLATASFGMIAGFGDRHFLSNGQSRTAKAIESLTTLVNNVNSRFNAELHIRAAIELQALEPVEAMTTFHSFIRNWLRNYSYDSNLALVSLCRMLFTSRKSSSKTTKPEFRRARIGQPFFLCGTSHDDWPLEPIEIIDGVPFLIVNTHLLLGAAEFVSQYLEYCVGTCDWNSYRFKSVTNTQKQAALDKLFASPKWKEELSTSDKEFLSAQIR